MELHTCMSRYVKCRVFHNSSLISQHPTLCLTHTPSATQGGTMFLYILLSPDPVLLSR